MRLAIGVGALLLILSFWAWAQNEPAAQGWLDNELAWESHPDGATLRRKADEGLYLVFGAGTTQAGAKMSVQAFDGGLRISTDRPARAVVYEVRPVAILEWSYSQTAKTAQGKAVALQAIGYQNPLVMSAVPCQKQICITPPAPMPLPGPPATALLVDDLSALVGWNHSTPGGEASVLSAGLRLQQP